MYLANAARETVEVAFTGPAESFLASLNMVFTIERADESDLQRAEELTVRTNQLNSTGRTYDYQELNTLRQSPDHLLLIASLDDKFGSYGRIGLALIECQSAVWTLKLLLMSCRVLSRGVGSVMLNQIMGLAKDAGVRLQAEFVENGRNRQMFITYRFAGFKELHQDGDLVILEHNLADDLPGRPPYMKVMTTWHQD
jgi:FkbH-like protein